jgi:undecaprenyl-diphosphatase
MNNQIFYFFYNLAHQFNFLDRVIIFLAVYLPWLVAISAFLFLIFHHNIHQSSNPFRELINKWKEFFFVFFSGGFAWIIAKIFKILIETPRPFLSLSDVQPLFLENGFAFPSGHATFFSALGFALFAKHKRVGYIFILFAILIGIARVMAGVHFPIDILGGFLLGWLIAYFLKNV